MTRYLILAAALTLSLPPHGGARAETRSPAAAAWIVNCMDQFKREQPDGKGVRDYCVCMHGYFDDTNEQVTQREMERMFPPAHRLCHRRAGWG